MLSTESAKTSMAQIAKNQAFLFRLNQTAKITIHEYMRKVWIYRRKNVKGWWIGWYESGISKAEALPSKALAEHYIATMLIISVSFNLSVKDVNHPMCPLSDCLIVCYKDNCPALSV